MYIICKDRDIFFPLYTYTYTRDTTAEKTGGWGTGVHLFNIYLIW